MSVTETLKNQSKQDERPKSFFRDDSFWRGVASAFELFGGDNRLLYYSDPWQADYEALRGDWEAVGWDLRGAMARFELRHREELEEAHQQQLFDPDEKA